MESLLNFSGVVSDQHLHDLRRQSESSIRSLKGLGVEPESYGTMLSSVLLNKLPPDLRLIVSRRISSENLDLEIHLETFEEELIARERANNTSTNPHRPSRTSTSSRVSTSAFSVTDGVCVFCQGSHLTTDCESVFSSASRKKVLQTGGHCYNCLRKNHISRNCRSSNRCKHCRMKHHTSICERVTQPVKSVDVQSLATSTDLNPTSSTFSPNQTNTLCSLHGKSILLQTARGIIYNSQQPNLSTEVRFLLDSGSQRSYLTERAMELLHLTPTSEQTLSIATFGTSQQQVEVCPIVTVGVALKAYPNLALSLYVVPTICEPLSFQPIVFSVEADEHLAGLDLADMVDDDVNLPVDVLIGCDYYWDLVTGGVCRVNTGPTAVHTKIGWVLSGPSVAANYLQHSSNCIVTTHSLMSDCQLKESIQLDEQLRSFWELQSFGICNEEKTLYDKFTDNVTFQDGRYEVTLPWKEFHHPLADNLALCMRRLNGLLTRLQHNPGLLKKYNSTIQEQLQKGIIEPVCPGTTIPDRVHYLPHHGVVQADKTTTKLRVVKDASARTHGPSLNECLYKGPKFNQLILDLLFRFRSYKVAVTADVEKAFLIIAVNHKDRDVLRFLWVDDITKEKPEIRIYWFTRVVFGVSSSPFLLNATVKYHLERFICSHEDVVNVYYNPHTLMTSSLEPIQMMRHLSCTSRAKISSNKGAPQIFVK